MTSDKHEYSYWVKLASMMAIISAITLIAIKVYAWIETGSTSLLASLTDSLLDVAASLINFFVIRYSLQPADDEHRFGHGKAESLAGLAQSAFIAGSSLLLLFHSADRIMNPEPVQALPVGMLVTLASIGITIGLVIFQSIVVRKTGSVAIKADSLHYRGDILLNLAVLAALWLSSRGFIYADGIIAILVAIYLMMGAFDIAKESAQHLMDRELSSEEQQQIVDLVMSHEAVYGVHELRTRRAGSTKFIQLHIEMDDDLTLLDAHHVADEVETMLRQHCGLIDVLIHQDPRSIVGKEHKVNDPERL